MVNSAIDVIESRPELIKSLGRVGLVVNQASTTQKYKPSVEAFARAASRVDGTTLACLFGPQHGYGQTEQDNMIETGDGFFALSDGRKLPLYSLYSKTRIPTPEQLADVDTLVVDLQDIGCRVYTYMLTLAGCIRSAAQLNKRVVVLDRPNPIGLSQPNRRGSFTQGNCLDMAWQSFVGWYPIPMRHGLTMGELGHFFMNYDQLKLDYEVIPVEGLKRTTSVNELSRLPWTIPSPNLPTWTTAFCFPAFVALETTTLSEGRGTTLPFQTVGAPHFPVQKIQEALKTWNETAPRQFRFCGLNMREHCFRPTFNKSQSQICQGIQFHPVELEENNLMALGAVFLTLASCEFNDFDWKAPGYEYNFTDPPVHLVLGHSQWKSFLDSIKGSTWNSSVQNSLIELLHWSEDDAQKFELTYENCHIYHS